jgi:hypothetical protein
MKAASKLVGRTYQFLSVAHWPASAAPLQRIAASKIVACRLGKRKTDPRIAGRELRAFFSRSLFCGAGFFAGAPPRIPARCSLHQRTSDRRAIAAESELAGQGNRLLA